MIGQISLLPLDVGFNVKDTGHPVVLPDTQNYEIKYLDAAGVKCVATGSRREIENILKSAGYVIQTNAAPH